MSTRELLELRQRCERVYHDQSVDEIGWATIVEKIYAIDAELERRAERG